MSNTSLDERIGPKSDAGVAGVNGEFLLEMLVCDLHGTAQNAGLTLQGLTNLQSGRCLRHLLHDDSAVMLLALRFRVEMGLSEAEGRKLEDIYRRLSALKRTTRDALSVPNQDMAEAGTCVAPWKSFASDVVDFLDRIAPLYGSHLRDLYGDDRVALCRYLTACINANGRSVEPPVLRQRRNAPRSTVNVRCTVETGDGQRIPATLNDVSSRGMGLSIDGELRAGEALIVCLPDGRRLNARVVSWNTRRCGLTLRTVLDAADPLLHAGRR